MVTLYLLAKYLSITFPLGALGGVDDGYALGLELVADAVGLSEIPGLFGGGALGEQGLDARVALLGLGLLAELGGGVDEAEAEHAVIVGDDGELGRVVHRGLERVVERGDGEGGVQVVVERGGEALAQLLHFSFV